MDYPYDNFLVDSFYKLLRFSHNEDSDDRVSAIELQLDADVTLPNQILAVILPAQYLDLPGVADQIDSWGATGLPYYIPETFKPSEVYGSILSRLMDFYRQEGLLK